MIFCKTLIWKFTMLIKKLETKPNDEMSQHNI